MTHMTAVTPEKGPRVIAAALIAPLTTVPVLALAGLAVVSSSVADAAAHLRGALHSSFFFAFFGLPVAYGVAGLLLFGAHLLGARPAKASPAGVSVAGSLTGAITMAVCWHLLFPNAELWQMSVIGTGMGLVAALTFLTVRDRRFPAFRVI